MCNTIYAQEFVLNQRILTCMFNVFRANKKQYSWHSNAVWVNRNETFIWNLIYRIQSSSHLTSCHSFSTYVTLHLTWSEILKTFTSLHSITHYCIEVSLHQSNYACTQRKETCAIPLMHDSHDNFSLLARAVGFSLTACNTNDSRLWNEYCHRNCRQPTKVVQQAVVAVWYTSSNSQFAEYMFVFAVVEWKIASNVRCISSCEHELDEQRVERG